MKNQENPLCVVPSMMITCDLCDLVNDLRLMVAQQQAMARLQYESCVWLTDLCRDLHARNLDLEAHNRTLRRMGREAARIQLPLWFWRSDERELKVQLFERARMLLEHSTSDDDTFDLLREFVDDWARPDVAVTDDQLANVIEYAARKKGR